MAGQRSISTGTHSARRERYLMGGDSRVSSYMAERTAAAEAAFFLPFLHPGIRVLDCGCGPGSITLGLAQAVRPGQVMGIDVSEDEIDKARRHDKEQGIENIRFEASNVYSLPLADGSFDAVFAHGLLEHLGEPAVALVEMKRVLKSGGVLRVRSGDLGGLLMYPEVPLAVLSNELRIRLQRHRGGDPTIGKRFRAILYDAGFCRIQATYSYKCFPSTDDVRWLADAMARWIAEGQVSEELVDLGWTDRDILIEIGAAWRAWGEDPGAFHARSWCEAVGWKE